MSGLKRAQKRDAPDLPKGYRSTKRGSKALKAAQKAEKRYEFVESVDRVRKRTGNLLIVTLQMLGMLAIAAVVLFALANGINWAARWNARRAADQRIAQSEKARISTENFVVVGMDGAKPVGFLAMGVQPGSGKAYGLAIPEGAFFEVPGTGFTRIGDSWVESPTVTAASISNFMTLRFDAWVVVPAAAYQAALAEQSVSALVDDVTDTNLSDDEVAEISKRLDDVKGKDIALLPMPVKPIQFGDQTYLEPQRPEVAELLQAWWGIDASRTAQITRVIVYNGSGAPGVAGEAGQALIRAGIRVVDTKNADRFDYAKTLVVVKHGGQEVAKPIVKALGVGEVRVENSEQNVTDVIVIIGKDYQP